MVFTQNQIMTFPPRQTTIELTVLHSLVEFQINRSRQWLCSLHSHELAKFNNCFCEHLREMPLRCALHGYFTIHAKVKSVSGSV